MMRLWIVGREINKVSQLYIVSVYGPRTPGAVFGPPGAVLGPPGAGHEDERCGLR